MPQPKVIENVKIFDEDYDLLNKLIPIGLCIEWPCDVVPNDHWHFADGSSFDPDIYPELHEVYPNNKLPDPRECALVGAGENTTFVENPEDPSQKFIAVHDVFNVGEFKDDQFQIHEHRYDTRPGLPGHDTDNFWGQTQLLNPPITSNIMEKTGYGTPRYGTVTRGKRIGTNYLIRLY